MATDATELARRIETIERSYEYLLAYAAQGRQHDQGSEARDMLMRVHQALDGFADEARRVLAEESDFDISDFLDALERDASAARGAVGLVLRRTAISSLLVDNLNASVHLRALLTDAFLVEQSLKGRDPA